MVDPYGVERWTRQEVFGERWSDRPLGDFVSTPRPVAWEAANPFADESEDSLRAWVRSQVRWRHHHDLDDVRQTSGFYAVYAARVDSMLEMLDAVLHRTDVDLAETSFLDLGAAEGYTANHLNDQGAFDIDACDINPVGLERLWRIRALTGRSYGRVGSLDLERTAWVSALDRTYDIVLALGIVYHMENPLLFCRNLRQATSRMAVIESDTPLFPENQRFRGFGNIYMHRDQVKLGRTTRYFSELRPDRRALVEMLLNAGFSVVESVPVVTRGLSTYLDSGEKSMVVAFVDAP